MRSRRASCSGRGSLDDRQAHDLNLLSFEPSGGEAYGASIPLYMVFDLERFLEEERSEPTTEDRDRLSRILDAAATMPPDGKLAGLVAAITPLVPGKSDQRRNLISMLGFAGCSIHRDIPAF